jgi:hypothetical protein
MVAACHVIAAIYRDVRQPVRDEGKHFPVKAGINADYPPASRSGLMELLTVMILD